MKIQKKLLLVTLALSFFLFVWMRQNFNGNHYGRFHYGGDEVHTYTQAVGEVFGHKKNWYRSQEGTRWLIKAFLPLGFYKLSATMGGTIVDDWQSGPTLLQKTNLEDGNNPNIRVFMHTLRTQSVLLFFLSLLPIFFYLLKYRYLWALFVPMLYVGFNLNTLEEQSYLYIEPSLMTVINLQLACFLYLMDRKFLRLRELAALGVLGGFILAVKFAGIFALLLTPALVLLAYFRQPWVAMFRTGFWGLVVVLSYAAFNYDVLLDRPTFLSFLHDFYSNFWNYMQTGNTPAGLTHYMAVRRQMIDSFGYIFDLFPLILFGGLWLGDRRRRLLITGFGGFAVLSIYFLVGSYMYIPRNYIVYYLPLLIAVYLSLEVVVPFLRDQIPQWRSSQPALRRAVVSLLLLLFVPSWLLGLNFGRIGEILPNCRAGVVHRMTQLTSERPGVPVMAFGYSQNFFNGTPLEGHVQREEDFPASYGDGDFKKIEGKFLDQIGGKGSPAIVMVKRRGHNFQLSNYLFPKAFAHNQQWCENFVFYN